MKTITGNPGKRAGVMMLGFVVAALICSMGVAQAGGNGKNKNNKHNNGHYESRGHGRHHGHQVNRSYQHQ